MKSSLVLYFTLLCFLSSWIVHGQDLGDPAIIALRQACIKETGVSEDLIDKANNEKILLPDPVFKCYMKCIMTKSGIMGPDGNTSVDVVISHLTPEQKKTLTPTVQFCGPVKGSDDCETAYLINKCYLEQEAANYYIV